MSLFDPNEVFSNKIERRVPRDALELAGSLRVSASQRMEHALRMVFPLRVARNFRADYTHRVIVVRRAMFNGFAFARPLCGAIKVILVGG